uniref:SH3 domain-containing protein n=1 Tax=Rhabditophanes sp. KR3021 TaxID=114890 RepID=A0AC35TL12_9BILA
MNDNQILYRQLIQEDIPKGCAHLEESHISLNKIAAFCEANYLESVDKKQAFEETKRYAVQSLGSVAYHISNLAVSALHVLTLQNEKLEELSGSVASASLDMKMKKEKCGRLKIGSLSCPKRTQNDARQENVMQKTAPNYVRKAIDFNALDDVGHGTIIPEDRSRHLNNSTGVYGSSMMDGNMSRMTNMSTLGRGNSSASAVYASNADVHHKMSTLSRGTLRGGIIQNESHYRVPSIAPTPMVDDLRYSTLTKAQAMGMRQTYNQEKEAPPSLMNTIRQSQHQYNIGYMDDSNPYGEYGTLKARPAPQLASMQYGVIGGTNTSIMSGYSGAPSIKSTTMVNNCGVTNNHMKETFSHHDDEDDMMPAPPPLFINNIPSPTSQYSDTRSFEAYSSSSHQNSSVPDNYLERAIVLFDYDAEKPDELALRENSIVYILRKNEDGWFEGVMNGATGLFPGNYVKTIN